MKLKAAVPGIILAVLLVTLYAFRPVGLSDTRQPRPVSLFDGKTFRGWSGDTVGMWRIRDGALVGGSLERELPKNDFLTTNQSYKNFDLELEFKLVGRGFVNAGVQFHSQRLTNPPHEMIGYQADLGDGFWASLYDESRRNKTLVKPDSALIARVLRRNDWNRYRVRTQNGRIQIWLNDQPTIDYTEPDTSIPQSGLIGLQVHSGGPVEVSYRRLRIRELGNF